MSDHDRSSAGSILITVVLAIVGVLAIWTLAPLNGFLLGNSYIAGDFMPVAALGLIFLVVLGVNPILRRLLPSAALSRAQRALLLGVLLVACVMPEAGLLRYGPTMLANECHQAAREPGVARVYESLQPPASLFPEALVLDAETPVSTPVLTVLDEDETIPWERWLPPLLGWGAFILPYLLMLVGMALIVLPQWRDVERQPMPLLRIQQMIIEDPGKGRLVPPLFRKRLFWIAVGTVFLLHLLSGLKGYMPTRVPAIQLSWDLRSYFTEGLARNVPGLFKSGRISFLFLGLTFFMPRRTGFSLWATQIIYGLGVAFVITYRPPYDPLVVRDHRNGAVLAIALFVLWTGRHHWRCVFGSLVRRGTDAPHRAAALLFLAGVAGCLGWLLWVGVSPGWAVASVVGILINALVVTRMVSETGLPVAPYLSPMASLMGVTPAALKSVANVYYGTLCSTVVATEWNRVCAGTMVLQGLALDERTTARGRTRLGLLFVVILVVSLVVAGVVLLMISYGHERTLNEIWSINSWGADHARTRRGQDDAALPRWRCAASRRDPSLGHLDGGGDCGLPPIPLLPLPPLAATPCRPALRAGVLRQMAVDQRAARLALQVNDPELRWRPHTHKGAPALHGVDPRGGRRRGPLDRCHGRARQPRHGVPAGQHPA